MEDLPPEVDGHRTTLRLNEAKLGAGIVDEVDVVGGTLVFFEPDNGAFFDPCDECCNLGVPEWSALMDDPHAARPIKTKQRVNMALILELELELELELANLCI